MLYKAPLVQTNRLSVTTAKLSPSADVDLPLCAASVYNNPYTATYANFVRETFDSSTCDVIAEFFQVSTEFYHNLYAVNTYYNSKSAGAPIKRTTALKQLYPEFSKLMEKLISSCDKFSLSLVKLEKLTDDVLKAERLQYLISRIDCYLRTFSLMPQTSYIIGIIGDFQRYKNLVKEVFAANRKILSYSKEYVLLMDKIRHVVLALYTQPGSKRVIPGEDANFIKEMQKIFHIMKTQVELLPSLSDILHNTENALLDLRVATHNNDELPNLTSYFNCNRSLIKIQIGLLSYLNSTSVKPVLKLWPFLNLNLGRSQSKEINLKADVIVSQKEKELARFAEKELQELATFVEIVTVCRKTSTTVNDLTILTKLLDLDVSKQNALIRFLVLEKIIDYYSEQNFHLAGRNLLVLAQNIELQLRYLNDITENLQSAKLLWNSILFKNINEFIFIQRRLQQLIAATELIFLNCEILFRAADKKNLGLKNSIIQKQLDILEMQNALLIFARECSGQEFVLLFYFRSAILSGFHFYDTTYENKTIASRGDRHNIVNGIPTEEIFNRNAIFLLRLEALRLEYQAKHRRPEENDYYRAIDNEELEEYLNLWAKEAREAKELKDAVDGLTLKAQKKKQENLEKFAAKKAKNAAVKPKEERRGAKAETLPTKPIPACTEDPLVAMLDNLLSQLNPKNFNADTVQQVLSKLYPLTRASSNKEVVFQALSAIGDSYGMIAGHYLNSNKHPKQLIVNLQLAINYYKQAELALRKLDSIPQKQHILYYTWLIDSICIQQRLLGQYTQKFTRQHTCLLEERNRYMRKNPKKWRENCLQEDWQPSEKTKNRHALAEALSAVALLQNASNELVERIKDKSKERDSELTFSFENYLHTSGKLQVPEAALNYTFDANEVTDTFMPDADVVSHTTSEESAKATPVVKILSRTAPQPPASTPNLATTAAVQHEYANAIPTVIFTRPANLDVNHVNNFPFSMKNLAKEIFKVLDKFLDSIDTVAPEEVMNSNNAQSVSYILTIAEVNLNNFNTSDLSAFLEKLSNILLKTNGFDNWLLKNQNFPDNCLKTILSKLNDFTQQGLSTCICVLTTFGVNNVTLLTDLYSQLIAKGKQQSSQTSTSLSSQFSLEMQATVVSSTHTAQLWQTQTNSRTECMEL